MLDIIKRNGRLWICEEVNISNELREYIKDNPRDKQVLLWIIRNKVVSGTVRQLAEIFETSVGEMKQFIDKVKSLGLVSVSKRHNGDMFLEIEKSHMRW